MNKKVIILIALGSLSIVAEMSAAVWSRGIQAARGLRQLGQRGMQGASKTSTALMKIPQETRALRLTNAAKNFAERNKEYSMDLLVWAPFLAAGYLSYQKVQNEKAQNEKAQEEKAQEEIKNQLFQRRLDLLDEIYRDETTFQRSQELWGELRRLREVEEMPKDLLIQLEIKADELRNARDARYRIREQERERQEIFEEQERKKQQRIKELMEEQERKRQERIKKLAEEELKKNAESQNVLPSFLSPQSWWQWVNQK